MAINRMIRGLMYWPEDEHMLTVDYLIFIDGIYTCNNKNHCHVVIPVPMQIHIIVWDFCCVGVFLVVGAGVLVKLGDLLFYLLRIHVPTQGAKVCAETMKQWDTPTWAIGTDRIPKLYHVTYRLDLLQSCGTEQHPVLTCHWYRPPPQMLWWVECHNHFALRH